MDPQPAFVVIADEPVAKPKRNIPATREANRNSERRKNGLDTPVMHPKDAPDAIPLDQYAPEGDLAAVVVRKTLSQLAAGKVTPTLRDGLTAQQLLDRRAEKAADRQFMLMLSRALAGGGSEPPQKLLPPPEDDVIEGEATEVDPLDENFLAPMHLRVG